MNSRTDLFAGDWFLVPKWKAQAMVNLSKVEMEREMRTMEREIHAVVCREKEREKEMARMEKEMEREIHAVKMQMANNVIGKSMRMNDLLIDLTTKHHRGSMLNAKA